MEQNYRQKIKFIYSHDMKSIHFTSDIGCIKRENDLWFRLESTKHLFENVENILIGIGVANNLSNLIQLSHTETYSDYEAEYNIKQKRTKLSNKEINQIKNLLKDGELSQYQIAEKFDTTRQVIRKIIKGIIT